MSKPVLILMYHRIDSPRCPVPRETPEERRYSVSLDEFSWQMGHMKAAGYRGISLGRLIDAWARDEVVDRRKVVVTFDDGNRSDHEHALPILLMNGFTATFFLTGSRIGRADGLDEGHIRDLASHGMELGAHGMTHRFLSELSRDTILDECRRSRDLVSVITGSRSRFFALPGGRYTGEVLDVLKALSFEAVCTSRFGYNRRSDDVFRLKRIPVTRSTGADTFRGFLDHSLGTVMPTHAVSLTRDLARRLLGERGYAALRSRFIRG